MVIECDSQTKLRYTQANVHFVGGGGGVAGIGNAYTLRRPETENV